MSVTVETLEKNMAKLTVTVAAEDIEKAMQEVYLKNRSKYQLPGFRKGKVSRAQLEKAYGKGLFYEDAVNSLIPGAYAAAVAESGLKIVSEPELDFKEVEVGKDMVFEATVAVEPEVVLGQYKGIEVAKADLTVTEEEVMAAIKQEQEKNSVMKEIEDRAVETGDTATIDFEGFVDGEAFEGGKGDNYPLTIGSGTFIPGFEEQIVGHALNEEFDVNVTFPENYGSENLAGKAAVFKCKVNKIESKELPELDDEFASEVSDFETFAEYKADVEKKEADKKAAQAEVDKANDVLDKVIENAQMDIPEAMIDTEVQGMINDMDNRLRMQGLSLEQYMEMFGQSIDQMKAQARPNATKSIQARLVLKAVAKAEGIEATEEEVEAEIAKLSDQYGMTVEEVKKAVDVELVKTDIINKKANDVIVAAAVEA